MFAPKKRKNVYAFDNFNDLESNVDEELFSETPERVHLPETPTVQTDTSNRVIEKLQETIDARGSFNSYEAGSVVYECYKMGFEDIVQIIDTFVMQNSGRIRSVVTPNLTQFADKNFYQKLSFGTLLNNKLALRANENRKSQIEDFSNQMTMGKLGGSAANLTRTYFYPNYGPFTGNQIVIEVLPRPTEEPSHVVLKRVLVSILSKACTNQEEISDNWVVSERGEIGNRRIFPINFYQELKVLCAEFFGLHHQVLKTEWKDTYRSLNFLASFPDSARQTRFEKLRCAKEVFETRSFHHYFKEALRELRYGSFAPLRNGETYRRFVPRQRCTRKTNNVTIYGVEIQNVSSDTDGNASRVHLKATELAKNQQDMDEVDENKYSVKITESNTADTKPAIRL